MKRPVSTLALVKAAVAEEVAAVIVPVVASMRDFQRQHCRVKVGSQYHPYDMVGRPALELATRWVDEILDSGRADCRIKIKGGAQWGKTVWALNTYAYLLGVKFLGVGYYLPDQALVDGIVDTKFRPDVVDQIPWFASLLKIGKTVNKSGKAVERKGAVMATDGKRVSLGYFLGTNRVPTTYTHDVQIVDERDDINERNEKFLDGRLTSSPVRLRIDIGTARYDKAGMDKEFEDSTQHCAFIHCEICGTDVSPEDEWPGVCRLQVPGMHPPSSDPHLTLAGDFKRNGEDGETVATHKPGNVYYLGCPHCNAPLNRDRVEYKPRRPEMAALGKYGIEVSQISTPAIGLTQIVAAWASAVGDPDKMVAFRCDRWARPKSSTQGLDSGIMDRCRQDYALSVVPTGKPRFGGLDTGDRLWFVARESDGPLCKRIAWAEQISPTTARVRVPQLFDASGLSCLFVDIGNERDMARDIVRIVNRLIDAPPVRAEDKAGRIDFGNGLVWDGHRGLWSGLRAACVEFSGRPGSGIVHDLRLTQEGHAYPVIKANRDETIQRAIDEFLTYDDGLVAVVDGKIRTQPVMRMPSAAPGCNEAVNVLQEHFISGSRKVAGSDGKTLSFIDGVPNHYLLANAYSALAEAVAQLSLANTAGTACETAARHGDGRTGRGRGTLP
ncbi:MAG: hypothetical protein EOM72_13595 [Opitutae bacterium]|nr:hypothetical protein [Opitutae bacterium]